MYSGQSPGSDQKEFWCKDVIEVIQELFENPDLKDDMCYTPVKLYTDASKNKRIYNEMWTSDFWHEMVVSTFGLQVEL